MGSGDGERGPLPGAVRLLRGRGADDAAVDEADGAGGGEEGGNLAGGVGADGVEVDEDEGVGAGVGLLGRTTGGGGDAARGGEGVARGNDGKDHVCGGAHVDVCGEELDAVASSAVLGCLAGGRSAMDVMWEGIRV